MSTLFTENRNLFHTFSRVAIQEGQGVAAAVNKTGHTVTTNDVWAEISKLPKNTKYFGNANDAYTDLKKVYDANSTEFSKYVKLYENAVLSPVDGSGQDFNKNQAWELLIDGKRVKNFVAPTDVFDNDGKPCNGYTLQLFDKSGTQIPATDGNWAFDYVAGLVIFERGKTPQDMGWASTASDGVVTPIKMTAWAYVGETLDKSIESIKDLIDKVQGEALGIEAGSGIIFDTNEETGNTIINTDISLVKVVPTSGYAASYQLQTSSGTVLGDTINITKDQFLKDAKIVEGSLNDGVFTESESGEKFIHFTFEINKKDSSSGKETAEANHVYLNIHDLVDVYTGGLAIEVASDNKINLIRSTNSENFFFANSTGAGVSGIQSAIDLAASGLISGVAEIPATATGFKYNTLVFTADGETAIIDVVNNKVVDISEENVDTITATTLSSSLPTVGALTGYVNDKFLSTISGGNGIDVSPFVNNTQTVSIKVDETAGNLVQVTENGIYVSASEYDLPVADINTLGGIKEGGHIEIDADGIVTVKQVQHSLKFGAKEYNGSEEKEILASDLGALTDVTAGSGIVVSTKSGDSQSISLNLKSDDKYLTLSGNALASKGIDEAIEAASGSIVTSFIEALNEEILARETGDTYITGTLLSGYSAINTVKAAEEALDLRLDAVEAQLGLGGGGNGNSSVTERLVEVEKTISAYTSTNTISSAIGSISSNVGSLLPLLGLEIQQADTAAGYAATYRLADKSGKQYGSVINIPKDQFLSGAEYDAEAKALKLTFALDTIDSQGFPSVTEHVATIPVGDLVDTYTAGNGITLENNQFSLVKDTDTDSKFLQIGTNTIGLSGVTDAIEYAVRTKAELADYTADGTAEAGTIQYAIRQNTAAIDKLNGDKDTVGSVDYKIDQYDQTISALITQINNLKNEI